MQACAAEARHVTLLVMTVAQSVGCVYAMHWAHTCAALRCVGRPHLACLGGCGSGSIHAGLCTAVDRLCVRV